MQLFMSDSGITFSKKIGWIKGPERTGRYALVIDHGKIVYAKNEPGGDVTVSSVKMAAFSISRADNYR